MSAGALKRGRIGISILAYFSIVSVVGMTSLLPQPVEQTLRWHARRYLRNARGSAGLRSELAGRALSGH